MKQEIDEELLFHIEQRTTEYIAAGMSPEEAAREARKRFGNLQSVREECRDRRGASFGEGILRDVRFAFRQWWKNPGFTIVVVITLALGIGASSAVFSVVETFLLRPLPFPKPAQLVSLRCDRPGLGQNNVGASVPEYEDLRATGIFSEVSLVFPMSGNLTGIANPQRVEAMAVSPSFFRLLGVSATLGRTFGAEEEKATGWAEGCVLSYAAWQKYFGGDPGVLERKIWLDYDTYRIIGVMPPDFRHPGRTLASDVDLWFTGGMRTAPFQAEPQRDHRIIPGLIGRLAPGMNVTTAQARLDVFAANTRQQFPDKYPATERWSVNVQTLQQNLVGNVRPVLWLLFGAVSLVLLICCATLANLFLVRAAGRRQELAMRCALGASRATIVRQLLVESVLLAGIGGLAGLWLAWWLPSFMVALAPVDLPRVNALAVNGRVIAFTAIVSGLTGIIFGLVPALHAARFDLVTSLKEGHHSTGATGHRLRSVFAVGQVALSLILLAGGGVLMKSFWQLLQVDPGFQVQQAVVATIWLPPPSNPNARQTYLDPKHRTVFFREILARLRTLPGVTDVAVGTGNCVPFSTEWNTSDFSIEGAEAVADTRPTAVFSSVTPDYFRTLGIPLQQGRAFEESDDGQNRVAIINQAAAARFWPDSNPVGRRYHRGAAEAPEWWTIIGVVGNVKAEGLDAPDTPLFYQSAYQRSGMGVAVFLRTDTRATLLGETIRREIQAFDPDLPVFGVRPMTDVMSQSLAARRFSTVIVGIFAAIALILAGLGVYSVVALTAAQRTHEIGVRRALGAGHSHILALVFRQGLALTAAGGAIGLLGALAFTYSLRGLLFTTSPFDPVTFGVILLLLGGVALLACWLPARRAAKVDPMVALRHE